MKNETSFSMKRRISRQYKIVGLVPCVTLATEEAQLKGRVIGQSKTGQLKQQLFSRWPRFVQKLQGTMELINRVYQKRRSTEVLDRMKQSINQQALSMESIIFYTKVLFQNIA